MRLLMLRAQINPSNFPQMIHENFNNIDDFYVHLVNELLDTGCINGAEIWYWGNPTFDITYPNGLRQRCFKDFNSAPFNDGDFDFVFTRGGFPEYRKIIGKANKTKKIYYGAGNRYFPQDKFHYDAILVDTKERLEANHKKYPDTVHRIFIKGYKPPKVTQPIEKEFNVCHCSIVDRLRGQEELGAALKGTNLSVLTVGPYKEKTKRLYESYNLHCEFTGYIPRNEVHKQMRRCKVGFIGFHKTGSGTPRTLIEFMAAGVPIILLPDVHVSSIYTPGFSTIKSTSKSLRTDLINSELQYYDTEMILEYYDKNFSLRNCTIEFSILLKTLI